MKDTSIDRSIVDLSIYLSIYLPTYPPIYPSIHPFIYVYLSIYLSIHLCLSIYLHTHTHTHRERERDSVSRRNSARQPVKRAHNTLTAPPPPHTRIQHWWNDKSAMLRQICAPVSNCPSQSTHGLQCD